MSKNFEIKLPPLHFNGIDYQLGLGGIHSVDKPGVFKNEDGYILFDVDVTSYYPSATINYKISPQHLNEKCFVDTLVTALADRKVYKKKKKENILFAALEYGLKIGLNSIGGLFGYPYFFLFDILCTYRMTVNCQLFILKLIEMISLKNYKILSANTDGILLYIKETNLNNVRGILSEWKQLTSFELEETFYDLYVRRDVNSYLARKTDGTIKIKGIFIPSGAAIKPIFSYDLPRRDDGYYLPIDGILKGFDMPVIAIALQKYYLSGIEPEDSIYDHIDIYDFCYTENINKQFSVYLLDIVRNLVTHNEKGVEHKKIVYKDVVLSKNKIQNLNRLYVTRPIVDENGGMSGQVIRKEKLVMKKEKVVLQEKIVIPAEYVIEKRINPETGRLKQYKEKIREKEIIPAVIEIVEKEGIQESIILGGNFVRVFNDYVSYSDFADYNIDYDYYIEETNKIINKIGRLHDEYPF